MIAGLETHEVSVYRATEIEEGPGDTTRSWGTAPVAETVLVRLERITAGRAQREFGIKTEAKYRAVVDEGVDVKLGDLWRLTAGPWGVGQDVLVLEVVPESDAMVLMVGLNDTNDGP